jgi:hypothetical protein
MMILIDTLNQAGDSGILLHTKGKLTIAKSQASRLS